MENLGMGHTGSRGDGVILGADRPPSPLDLSLPCASVSPQGWPASPGDHGNPGSGTQGTRDCPHHHGHPPTGLLMGSDTGMPAEHGSAHLPAQGIIEAEYLIRWEMSC